MIVHHSHTSGIADISVWTPNARVANDSGHCTSSQLRPVAAYGPLLALDLLIFVGLVHHLRLDSRLLGLSLLDLLFLLLVGNFGSFSSLSLATTLRLSRGVLILISGSSSSLSLATTLRLGGSILVLVLVLGGGSSSSSGGGLLSRGLAGDLLSRGSSNCLLNSADGRGRSGCSVDLLASDLVPACLGDGGVLVTELGCDFFGVELRRRVYVRFVCLRCGVIGEVRK